MASAVLTGEYRRGKTALFLILCGWLGAAPHWLESIRTLYPAITLAVLLGGYGLRTVLRNRKKTLSNGQSKKSSLCPEEDLPAVDVLVAARDEERY